MTAAACVSPHIPPVAAPDATIGRPWRAERLELLDAINAARRQAGLAPLAYDALLERVGDLQCANLIRDGVWGHYALDGVPPYARYLFAGGHGFHRENAASRTSSVGVTIDQMGGILQESLEHMLAERPPADGHRRTLLDPTVTHIGIGIAMHGGEVRVTHELAVEVATEWAAAPAVSRPRTRLEIAGRLAAPWMPAAVEVLWEPLPRPLLVEQAMRLGSYGYPPRRSISYANEHGISGLGLDSPSLRVYTDGRFTFAWTTGPDPGLEVLVVWAMRSPGQRELTAVAASATAVTADGTTPPALAPWIALRK